MNSGQHEDTYYIQQVLNRMLATMVKKGNDYSHGYTWRTFENLAEFNRMSVIKVIFFQITQKIFRLQNLIFRADYVENEPVEDTWLDIACYAVLYLSWTLKQKELERESSTHSAETAPESRTYWDKPDSLT